MARKPSGKQAAVLTRLVAIRKSEAEQRLEDIGRQLRRLDAQIKAAREQLSELDTHETSKASNGLPFLPPHIHRNIEKIRTLKQARTELEAQLAGAKQTLARAIHAEATLDS
jgi:hypothetical protein